MVTDHKDAKQTDSCDDINPQFIRETKKAE